MNTNCIDNSVSVKKGAVDKEEALTTSQPRTVKGTFASGPAGRRKKSSDEPVDRIQFREEFVQTLIKAFQERGKAGVKHAIDTSPKDFLTLLSNVINAKEADTIIQRLVIMGFPVQPPDDWVPELRPEGDTGNAT